MPQIGYYPPPQGPGPIGAGLQGAAQGMLAFAQLAQRQSELDAKVALAKEQAEATRAYREGALDIRRSEADALKSYREGMLGIRQQAEARGQAELEFEKGQAALELSEDEAALEGDLYTLGAMRNVLYSKGVGKPGEDFEDILGESAAKVAREMNTKDRRQWFDEQLFPTAIELYEQYQTGEFQRRAELTRSKPGVEAGKTEAVAVDLADNKIDSETAFASLEQIEVEGAERASYEAKFASLSEGVAALQVDPDILDADFGNERVAKMLGYLSSDLTAAKTPADLGAIYSRMKRYKTLASTDTQAFIDEVGRDLADREKRTPAPAGERPKMEKGEAPPSRGGLGLGEWLNKDVSFDSRKRLADAQDAASRVPNDSEGLVKGSPEYIEAEKQWVAEVNRVLEQHGIANLTIDEIIMLGSMSPEEAYRFTGSGEPGRDWILAPDIYFGLGLDSDAR